MDSSTLLYVGADQTVRHLTEILAGLARARTFLAPKKDGHELLAGLGAGHDARF